MTLRERRMVTDGDKSRRVVVTGIGPLSSVGIGKDAFWDGVRNKKITITKEDVTIGEGHGGGYFVHRIKDFDIHHYGIEKKCLDEMRRWKGGEEVVDLDYLMAAARLALDDSRLAFSREKNNIGLVLSHENPGLNQFADKAFSLSYNFLNGRKVPREKFFAEMYAQCHKSVYDLQTFMFLFHVGKVLGIHGNSLFLNNACASGLYALDAAGFMIKSGHCPAVIVAAADHPDMFKYAWFHEMGMYAADGKIKPFSEDADGLVFGDGGAGIVLESLDHALDRDADIYAEYLGGAFSFEGWKVSLPAVHSDYYKSTILRAMEKAGISVDHIDLVIPHGAGIKVTDRYEAEAICEIFTAGSDRPLYSAFKPFVGHNLGGSALLETVMLLLAMKERIVPPTLNCIRKNRKIMIDLITEFTDIPIDHAVKTATAFGGFDGAVVLRSFNK